MTVQPIPEGYSSVTPYLVVPGVDGVLSFVQTVFDAEITGEPIRRPDGSVMHAEVRIGDARVMMGEPTGDMPPLPAMLYVYVEDTDATYARALAAGGESVMEPADQFYGDRNAGVRGPGGTMWWMGTHVEDVSEEEIRRRAAEHG